MTSIHTGTKQRREYKKTVSLCCWKSSIESKVSSSSTLKSSRLDTVIWSVELKRSTVQDPEETFLLPTDD